MARRMALFGGSFNPPGLHHLRIAEVLAREFDEVRIIPCGPRPDKPEVNSVPSVFRAALCDLTFGCLEGAEVDLFDLEQDTFTRNHALEDRYSPEAEVWHVVGADWIEGGARKQSAIHTGWEMGPELWERSRFAILTRPGHALDARDLPPKHVLIPLEIPGSSTEIRDSLLHRRKVEHLLTPKAHRYINRYGLYRGTNPATWSRGSLEDLKCMVQKDPRNGKSIHWEERFREHESETSPDFILTLGGDGAMLRCIREYWRRRLPFFGVNAGHVGFLMNAPEQVFEQAFPPSEVIFRQLPQIYIEMETAAGETIEAYASNDAWMERSTSQSAWLEVQVNGIPRLPKLVSDGALVSTAAGSTAYARAMGASPLLADTPAWLLVGSNVLEPAHWKSALLSNDSTVEITNLESEKRPTIAYVDGIAQGEVRSFRARLSRAATAELVFLANRDMAEKIAGIQFMR
ncbi:MAG TPA: NAD(+)/NADH kinase [Candidatus Saccharimonadia bacterium]|nr:NAD(+)/NADH kinase [Candidatus Saccharimonadia bacterium]